MHIIRTRRLKKVKDDAFAEGRISNTRIISNLLDTNNKLTADLKRISGGKLTEYKRKNRILKRSSKTHQ